MVNGCRVAPIHPKGDAGDPDHRGGGPRSAISEAFLSRNDFRFRGLNVRVLPRRCVCRAPVGRQGSRPTARINRVPRSRPLRRNGRRLPRNRSREGRPRNHHCRSNDRDSSTIRSALSPSIRLSIGRRTSRNIYRLRNSDPVRHRRSCVPKWSYCPGTLRTRSSNNSPNIVGDAASSSCRILR
jgi:hypothetical protein